MIEYPPEHLEAIRALAHVLAEREALAPPLPGNWAPSEWVMVVAWTDMDSGDTRMTRVNAENMVMHHLTGLLAEAAKDDWDGPVDQA